MTFTELPPVSSDHLVPFTGQLRLAVAAYLARFKGSTRYHTESDLRCYLVWCAARSLDPLAARRPHLELYVRWMQETRRFKPSTVSRRFSVTAGFYRTCVVDGLLEHSPAEHVRRPSVPPESPTLGFTHLQFEALLTAARESSNPCDFALVAMPGLLGLRIFEATGADIADLGEEHGHRVLRVCGKGTKIVLIPLPPAVGRAIDRAVGTRSGGPILLNTRGARMDRHAATRRLKRLAEVAGVQIARPHPHMLRHTFVTTMLDAGVDLRDVQIAARHADPRTAPRYDTTGPARTSTATRTTSWPPTWHPALDRAVAPTARPKARTALPMSVRSHLGYAGDPVVPDVSEVPATDHWRPGGRSAVCPPPMSECADGDARVVEHEARLVVGQAASELEDRRGVVVALGAALIGGARVVLAEPFDTEVQGPHVCGRGGRPGTNTQTHSMYGQGIGHGRGLQVDVETAIQVGSDLAIELPAAETVGLELNLTDTRRRSPGDPRASRSPVLVQPDRVVNHPGLAVLDSGGTSIDVIAMADGLEVDNLEP